MVMHFEPQEVIFDKVITDLGLQEGQFDPKKFIKWGTEAIAHIGGLNRFPLNQVYYYIDVNNYTCNLDYWVKHVNEVWFHEKTGPGLPMSKDEHDYHKIGPCQHLYQSEDQKPNYILSPVNKGDSVYSEIKINKRYGDVFMKTSTILINDSKFYVPNIESYKEAVYWYITTKLLFQEAFRGRQEKVQSYQYAVGMWSNFRNLAYAELMMPDEWEMDQIAKELSLGVSYTGLNHRQVPFLPKQSDYSKVPIVINSTRLGTGLPLPPGPPFPPVPTPVP